MQLIICESAALNDDGTFNIHRGGLIRFPAKDLPYLFRLTLVITADVEEVGSGDRPFEIHVEGTDNERWGVKGTCGARSGDRSFNLAVPINAPVSAPGLVMIRVKIGDAEGRASFTVGPTTIRAGFGEGD